MILEDNDDILMLISIALEENGYAVIAAGDSQPLHEIHMHQPDLILMDNVLKNDSGNDLCLRLKNDPDTRHLPIVLVSAHPALKDMATACGADAYLSKPFNIADLLRMVRRFV